MPGLALFDILERNDAAPMRPGETRFGFLNRSASSYYEAVRNLIEEWLSHVPDDGARNDLIGALRSNNRQHDSAFWELYLHEGFRRSGYDIEIHPDIIGNPKHPDFLLTDGSQAFYLEVVSVGARPEDIAEDRRLDAVYSVLEELKTGVFVFGMHHYSIGANSLPTKGLRDTLAKWIGSLDPVAVEVSATAASVIGATAYPTLHWEREGWKLEFVAIPLRADAPTPRRTLAFGGPGEAAVVDNTSGILRVLDDKASKYGPLDLPLVIAVQSNTEYPTRDYEVERALYGMTTRRANDPRLSFSDVVDDGFWLSKRGWQRVTCPQVVSIYDLAPWSVARVEPRTWNTLEPGARLMTLPNWIRPITLEGEPGPGPGADLAVHFGVDRQFFESDPDFDLS
jgi:hypothetical protein